MTQVELVRIVGAVFLLWAGCRALHFMSGVLVSCAEALGWTRRR